ncbi:MAG: hypothetical protein K0S88_6259 [Actinomycetia bacterium]|nr:hypothetical protein [Actinomycetes bacterium]
MATSSSQRATLTAATTVATSRGATAASPARPMARRTGGSQRGPERKPAVTAHSPTATHSQLRARRKARAA